MGFDKVLTSMQANWPEAATPQSAVAITVQRFAALLQASARKSLLPYDLNFTEFEILAALRSSHPSHQLNPTALYSAILISSGGLTKALKSLEARSLVARPEQSEDRRKRPITLTAEGRNVVEAAMASVRRGDEEKFERSSFKSTDCVRLVSLLSDIVSSFEP